MANQGIDTTCRECGAAGHTAHDLTWSNEVGGWVCEVCVLGETEPGDKTLGEVPAVAVNGACRRCAKCNTPLGESGHDKDGRIHPGKACRPIITAAWEAIRSRRGGS